jgi:energy-converting hydrogenase Eha subunit B
MTFFQVLGVCMLAVPVVVAIWSVVATDGPVVAVGLVVAIAAIIGLVHCGAKLASGEWP